jgi:hypothetical protein
MCLQLVVARHPSQAAGESGLNAVTAYRFKDEAPPAHFGGSVGSHQ